MTFMFGLIFLLAGIFGFCVMFTVGWGTGQLLFCLIAFPFGGIFMVIGGAVMRGSIAEKKRNQNILDNGEVFTGRIIEYRDGQGVVVNGVPPLSLVVEFDRNGEPAQIVIPSGGNSEEGFPIGAWVDFSLLGVEAVLHQGTVRFG